MTLLDYTIGNDTFEYPVSDEQLRQFFKSELSSYDIVDEYLDNYYEDETEQDKAELYDMYGTDISKNRSILIKDAYGWPLDILVQNAYDYYNDESWKKAMLKFFEQDARNYYFNK